MSRGGGDCPGGSLFSGISVQVGVSLQRGLCLVGSVHGVLGGFVKEGFYLGSLCAGALCSGVSVWGLCTGRRSLSSEVCLGVSVLGSLYRELCPGDIYVGGLC